MKSPLRWVGGKQAEAEYLSGLLPFHSCYVEVFGGGGSVLLAKRPSEVEVYNDLNGELVNFFRVLRDAPEAFKESWKYCLVSREEFYRLRDADLSTMDPVQRAHRFLYVNRTAFGGDMEGKGCVFGISTQSLSALTVWLKQVEKWTDNLYIRLKDCYIENLNFSDLLKRWDNSKAEPAGTVFFCDPPYADTKRYAIGEFTHDDHRKLAETLGGIENRFLLTINDHPLVRELYDGCHILERTKQYSISRGDAGRREYGELIIANYVLPKQTQVQFDLSTTD